MLNVLPFFCVGDMHMTKKI